MSNRNFWIAVAVVVLLFGGWAIFAALYVNAAGYDVAAFGVSFGVVNALFSGIAFAAFVWSLIRQQGQNSRDNAGNQFYTLLQSWQSLIQSAHYKDGITGRTAIEKCADDIMLAAFMVSPQTPRDEILNNSVNGALALYRNIDGSKDRIMGHYFRLLYHVVKHVDDAESFTREEKRRYVDIAVAHMSQAELRLLFYNCLTPKGRGFYKYVEEYEMLENFDVGILNELKTLLAYPARLNQFLAENELLDLEDPRSYDMFIVIRHGKVHKLSEYDKEILKNTPPAYVGPVKKSTAERVFPVMPQPSESYPLQCK